MKKMKKVTTELLKVWYFKKKKKFVKNIESNIKMKNKKQKTNGK